MWKVTFLLASLSFCALMNWNSVFWIATTIRALIKASKKNGIRIVKTERILNVFRIKVLTSRLTKSSRKPYTFRSAPMATNSNCTRPLFHSTHRSFRPEIFIFAHNVFFSYAELKTVRNFSQDAKPNTTSSYFEAIVVQELKWDFIVLQKNRKSPLPSLVEQ